MKSVDELGGYIELPYIVITQYTSVFKPVPHVVKLGESIGKRRPHPVLFESKGTNQGAEENFNCTWDSFNRLTIHNAQPFIRAHPATQLHPAAKVRL
jgi:hypothetical protein